MQNYYKLCRVVHEKYHDSTYSDKDGDYNNCRNVLEELGFNDASDADCANVRYVCTCVSRRAAHLAAAGVAVLLNRINEESITVAVDGSVYRFHPHFHNLMVEQISHLIKPGIKVSDVMISWCCIGMDMFLFMNV